MRDRLIELIRFSVGGCARYWAEIIADYLIANGVIVPPCKVGDTVYAISENRISEANVIEINISLQMTILLEIICDYNCDGCPFGDWTQSYDGDYSCSGEYGTCVVNYEDFGKTVFLSREEAEKALAERKDK